MKSCHVLLITGIRSCVEQYRSKEFADEVSIFCCRVGADGPLPSGRELSGTSFGAQHLNITHPTEKRNV